MRLSAAVVLMCLLAGGAASAREHHEHRADARRHLEKANALAGEGKCAAAVREYTAAYEKLQDPIVLFNRADCYRQLGENSKAAEDYRGFLAGFPAAPNRKEIEARIATLEKPVAPRAPAQKPAAATTAPPPIARTPAGASTPPAPVPPPRTATLPPTPPPPRAAALPPAPPPPRTLAPAPAEAVGPMPFLPPPPSTGESKSLVEAPSSTPSVPPAEASQGSRWWIWTTLAVVVVGGGVAAYWFLRPKDEPLPPSTLGNYRF